VFTSANFSILPPLNWRETGARVVSKREIGGSFDARRRDGGPPTGTGPGSAPPTAFPRRKKWEPAERLPCNGICQRLEVGFLRFWFWKVIGKLEQGLGLARGPRWVCSPRTFTPSADGSSLRTAWMLLAGWSRPALRVDGSVRLLGIQWVKGGVAAGMFLFSWAARFFSHAHPAIRGRSGRDTHNVTIRVGRREPARSIYLAEDHLQGSAASARHSKAWGKGKRWVK
jgi:hypothetical protein